MSQKVIYFVTSLQSGGIENYLLRFLRDNHQKFDQIVVFCKSGKAGQLESEYKSLTNVSVIRQRIGFFNPLVFLKLLKYFKINKFDAICDFTGNFAGQIVFLSKCAGIRKRIVFYRGSSDRFSSSRLKLIFNNWVKSLVFKYATDILSNSQAALNYFFNNKWETDSRFEVIYNGVNSSDFLKHKNNLRKEFNIPADAFVVGHTGRFDVAKNHQTILAVAEQLVFENPKFYFILCGNKVKISLEKLLVEKGLNERILVFENRADIPQFLNTMDCYYFPSVTEGQPNALIEAMIMNIPIVASDIEPIKETVPYAALEYLVRPLDIKAAKEKILTIYNERGNQNFQNWAIQHFESESLFQKFFNRF
ncbi:glycosyltransferase [Sphingobacterium anhuiense]|uniref:glycosyltransferase n=1 Tax=Sphingobacterium anhuiense TaxID=493780 RepID=UPI003C2F4004